MTRFDPTMRYMFYAEDFEENILGYCPQGDEEWASAVHDTVWSIDADEARKILSELGLPTRDPFPRRRLEAHYRSPETRAAVLETWGHAPTSD